MKELKLAIHFKHEILGEKKKKKEEEKKEKKTIITKKGVGRSYIVYSLELIAQPISRVQPTDSNMCTCHMNSVFKLNSPLKL